MRLKNRNNILWRVRVAPLIIAGSGSELLDRFIH
jgi:hypothetical protein